MGQKVNPHGLRVGIIKGWDTQWYADKKEFAAFLKEDHTIRTFLKKKYYAAAVSRILIERAAGRIVVTVYTGRPGVLIGKAGSEIEVIKKDLSKITKGKPVSVNITEVRKPDADAQLVAEGVAAQLEKRVGFRRALKQAIGRTMRSGVKGVKMQVSRPSRRTRDRGMRALSRGQHSPSDAARGHRLRLCGSTHDVRYDRRQVLDLQG